MNKFFVALCLPALLTLSLGGCSSDLLGLVNQGVETQAQRPTATPPPIVSQSFDANDTMFAQMMIPHHAQAVELAALATANTTTPAIRDLAARIAGAQQPEILSMEEWLVAAGIPTDGHGSHAMAMPGLVSDADMEALEKATNAEFDALFLAHMIRHHEGAIAMATDVLATTKNDNVRALANAIVAAQTAEIAEMSGLLGP